MGQRLCKAVDRFSETVIDDEVVVMNLDSGDFFSLTGTAKEIWQLIDNQRDRESVLGDLARKFACSEAEIEGDLDAFLGQLCAAGLLAAA